MSIFLSAPLLAPMTLEAPAMLLTWEEQDSSKDREKEAEQRERDAKLRRKQEQREEKARLQATKERKQQWRKWRYAFGTSRPVERIKGGLRLLFGARHQ